MSVTVKCFASLKEQIGIDQTSLAYLPAMTVNDVWQAITEQPVPENLLCARNYEYVSLEQSVDDGDEIAFFPPVTGG